MAEESGLERGSLVRALKRHPVIVATFVGCTLLGVVLGIWFMPEGWTLVRRIAGGALGGAGCGLIITAPRIIG